ncbi:hypothetical protein J4421_04180 [Candidatus Woesearchaeota archaeon]|nr:hypothetical protein [Candidatus Woesearchaeota archaeon]
MPLRIPESMKECLYFTNRGDVLAWVYRKECPKCHKAKMGKPVDSKGSVKIRAKEYECPACKYQETKEAHEDSVQIQTVYTCPKCQKKGEATAPYKRKSYRGVPSFIIKCQHCGEKILLTKKLKELKSNEDRRTKEDN